MKHIKVILAILALLAVCLVYWPDRKTYIPKKLWGVWQTDYKRYAGRHLDISEAIFTIGQGQEQIKIFFIQHVKTVLIGQRERYTLYFRENEAAKGPLQKFTFYYRKTEKGDRLQLKNQEIILWYRKANLEPAASSMEAATP